MSDVCDVQYDVCVHVCDDDDSAGADTHTHSTNTHSYSQPHPHALADSSLLYSRWSGM